MTTANRRLLIVHGTAGHPGENWFPWLRKQAVERGWIVDVPSLPTPEGQTLNEWNRAFHDQCGSISEYDVAVGHSLGACLIIRLLEITEASLPLLISVAGCVGATNVPEFDQLNSTFVAEPYAWDRLQRRISNAVVIYSSNDPYISEEQTLRLIKGLNARSLKLQNAGHINTAAGYSTLPALLDILDAFPMASAILDENCSP